MTYRRETKNYPSQPERGFTPALKQAPTPEYLRYRTDFTGPAINFSTIAGWKSAMDNKYWWIR